jgi:hypothetical protein
MQNFSRIYPDIRPIGPSGSRLTSLPGQRYGLTWSYDPVAITAIGVSPSSVLAGTGLLNPVFTIAYSGTPSGANISTAGTGTLQIPSPFTSFTWSGVFPTGIPTSVRTFTINVTGMAGNTTSTTVPVVWHQYYYYGVRNSGTYNQAFIESLTSSGVSTTGHAGTIVGDIDEFMFYAFRADVNTPTFLDTLCNIKQLWTNAATVAFTNKAGFTENYRIFRTDYSGIAEATFVLGTA